MWNKTFVIGLITSLIWILANCTPHTAENLGQKPLAWGKPDKVTLYCSDPLQDSLLTIARASLEQTFSTVIEKEEQLFSVQIGEMSKIDLFYRFNNLLFVSSLGLNDSTSRYIESILPEAYKEKIRTEGPKMFSINDFWAKGQLAVFVIANTSEDLLAYFSNTNEKLFPLFYDQLLEKEKNYIFHSGSLKSSDDILQQHVGIQLPIPKIFKPFRPDSIPDFISYRYFNPREDDSPIMFLLFRREPLPTSITKEWLGQLRLNTIGSFYKGDTFALADAQFAATQINSYPAYQLRSYWQNYTDYTGGVFETYALPDKNEVVIIDLMLYYPQGNKLLHMVRLRSILENLQLLSPSQAINKHIYGGYYEIS